MKLTDSDRKWLRRFMTFLFGFSFLTIFSMGINALGINYGLVSCTGSMRPTLDCPCLTMNKVYDSNFNNNFFLASENKSYENFKFQANDEKINQIIKKDINVGDVILYRDLNGRGNILHRVIDICYDWDIVNNEAVNTTPKGFYLRGDNNTYSECIEYKDIISKMIWKSC